MWVPVLYKRLCIMDTMRAPNAYDSFTLYNTPFHVFGVSPIRFITARYSNIRVHFILILSFLGIRRKRNLNHHTCRQLSPHNIMWKQNNMLTLALLTSLTLISLCGQVRLLPVIVLMTERGQEPPHTALRALTSTGTSNEDNIRDVVVSYGQDAFWVPGNADPTMYRFPHKTFTSLSSSAGSPLVVVGVLSAAHLRAPRDSIRQSWAYNRSNVFFLVGGNWTEQIDKEFNQHNDLIWIDAPEAYRDITAKVLCLYASVHKHLPNYHYVMKTDDDSYVRLFDIEQGADLAKARAAETRKSDRLDGFLYWGKPCIGHRVIRTLEHKWQVPVDLYAAETFPRYAAGAGYVLSRELMDCVVRTSHFNSPTTGRPQVSETLPIAGTFPIEDAYTAILVDRCGGSCLRDMKFYTDMNRNNGVDASDHVLVMHKVKKAENMEAIHLRYCCSTLTPDPKSCAPFIGSCMKSVDSNKIE
jgi:hypothetical protein